MTGFVFRAATTAAVSAGATSLAIAVPAGTVNGDLLLALVGEDFTSSALTFTGWTNTAGQSIAAGGGRQGIGLWRRIASGEPGSYTVGFSGSTTNKVITMLSYAGPDPVTPHDQHAGGSNSSNSTTMVAPSINNTNPNELVLACYGYKNNSAFTPPGSMTQRSIVSIGALYTIAICDLIQTAIGATGTKTGTIATTTTNVFLSASFNPLTAPPIFWQDFVQSIEIYS